MKEKKVLSVKIVAVLLVAVLLVGGTVGGTLAWLVSKPDSVVNTFTFGDINAQLTETTGATYKIVPGNNIAKDPQVTVLANSEACWLFVKIEEKNWPTFTESDQTTRKVTYEVADGWKALTGVSGVYYREVPASTTNTDFYVLNNNQVTVSNTLTKEEVDEITTSPTLTFTAYAVQKDNVADAATAWSIANPTN